MKLIKKIAAIMFAFMMVFSLSTNAKAESGVQGKQTGTITINKAIKDQEYKIYKILDLESFSYDYGTDPNKGAYSYKLTSDAWADFFRTGDGAAYVNVDEQNYVTWKNETNIETQAAELSKKALAYAVEKSIPETKKATAENTTLEFRDLALGYYLVDSSAGALCGLNTTNSNVKIEEKNNAPKVDKYIGTNKKMNTANIGDRIDFTTDVTLYKGAKNCILYDTMDYGFELNKIATVPNKPDFNKQVYIVYNYTKELDSRYYTFEATGNTFKIKFDESFLNSIEDETHIMIQYSATLTSNAQITYPRKELFPNKNTTYLTYGDNSIESNHSETSTYTFGLPVFKYTNKTKNTNDKTPLAEAKFKLYDSNGTEINFVKLYRQDVAKYRIAKTGDDAESKQSVIETDSTGRFNVVGLKSGIYELEETKAPDGYNILTGRIRVEIKTNDTDGTTSVKLLQKGEETDMVYVKNNSGTLLPSTGGMGTTLIYLIGGALVLGSGFVLANKKRAKAK